MTPVVTAEEMRALERVAIEEIGLPAFTLMETAGRGVAQAILELEPEIAGPVAVVCGPGNNGGDGFVIARVLRQHGVDATAYLAVRRAQVTGVAAAHLAVLEKSGGVVRELVSPLGELGEAIEGAALVVDALFGTGLARPIEGHLADVVARMNAAPLRVAVDIPSGLDTDTGRTLGVTVRADHTVTMAALKPALVGAPGFASCGEVSVVDIGVPNALIAATSRASVTQPDDLVIPWHGELAYKTARGHVLVIGGAPGMRGAGRLAAIAALRAGAGVVTLAAAGDVTGPDAVMTRSLTGPLGALLDGKAAVVIGPGLGRSAEAAGWIAEVLASGVPAVFDADALNALTPAALAAAAGPIVITPHPGEAARLLGSTAAAIEADRLAAARELAARTKAVAVLKGARTVICDGTLGDDHCLINPTGTADLATAGSGDVLAGAIGGLLAQGLAALDAARTGVFVHGIAGTEHTGNLIASDLPELIGRMLRVLVES